MSSSTAAASSKGPAQNQPISVDDASALEVLTESTLIFARLVQGDEKLQVAAMESDAVEKLAQIVLGKWISGGTGCGGSENVDAGAVKVKGMKDRVLDEIREGQAMSERRRKVVAVSTQWDLIYCFSLCCQSFLIFFLCFCTFLFSTGPMPPYKKRALLPPSPLSATTAKTAAVAWSNPNYFP